MLHINRKPGEAILLDNGKIRIVVSEIHGKIVKLSIEAPQDVDILREELTKPEICNDGSDYC